MPPWDGTNSGPMSLGLIGAASMATRTYYDKHQTANVDGSKKYVKKPGHLSGQTH
jgi:hypothetical protein